MTNNTKAQLEERIKAYVATAPLPTPEKAARLAGLLTLPEYVETRTGHIYVVEFSTGVIKVGRTINVTSRINEHRHAAEKVGSSMVNTWVSDGYEGYQDSERDLIAWCTSQGSYATRNRSEYFKNLRYEDVVTQAESIVERAS